MNSSSAYYHIMNVLDRKNEYCADKYSVDLDATRDGQAVHTLYKYGKEFGEYATYQDLIHAIVKA